MSWAARATDGAIPPQHPALRRAWRLWLTTVALVGATLGLALTGTTTATAAHFTYNAPDTTRVDVQQIAAAESAPSQVSDEREGSASSSAAARGASTTPLREVLPQTRRVSSSACSMPTCIRRAESTVQRSTAGTGRRVILPSPCHATAASIPRCRIAGKRPS